VEPLDGIVGEVPGEARSTLAGKRERDFITPVTAGLCRATERFVDLQRRATRGIAGRESKKIDMTKRPKRVDGKRTSNKRKGATKPTGKTVASREAEIAPQPSGGEPARPSERAPAIPKSRDARLPPVGTTWS
jgi:hypothetical protein